MGEITEKSQIELQRPHAKQQEILNNRKRFNYLRCGRRFGKTSIVSFLTAENINGITGIFAPTYKDLHEIWMEVKHRFAGVTYSKNEQLKQLVFITGGKVDFWSLEDPNNGRGRKYHRIIIDEAEKIRGLKEAWTMNLRYTLVDYAGDSYMLTTPKGARTYFDSLYSEAKKDPINSACFQYSTADNPFIPKDEIESMLATQDDVSLQQEFYGNAVDWGASKRFVYPFSVERHVSKVLMEQDLSLPIYASFDFNADPMTCIVAQHDLRLTKIRILKEYRIMNAGAEAICERLKNDFDTTRLIVTGDRSGYSRDKIVAGYNCNYDIIKKTLRLGNLQVRAPRVNPLHTASRAVICSILDKHPDILFNDCPYLIDDLLNVQANENGGIKKEVGATGHLLDCLLYYLHHFCKDWVKKPLR